ncbi:MDR family MFS transporter [Heyndrickxia faecalis]|uniref:MDR family MFS transporter n=1 Tax=Heyndrickxia faecalis TaxID=2824910 RepID=UPI003D193384
MPKTVWLLVIGMAVNMTGASFLWPLNSIYIHDHLGKSLFIAGLVLMLNNFTSVIGSLLGGYLHDKIGGYRSVLLGGLISAVALAGLTWNHAWPDYVFFLGAIGLGSGMIGPAILAMAGAAWKGGGRKAFNAIYVANNIGVALGAALGGVIASYSIDLIFAANLALFLVFMVIAIFGYRNIAEKHAGYAGTAAVSAKRAGRAQVASLILLCFAYFLAWTAYTQWTATISTYTQTLHISLNKYSFLWTLNGAIIVLGQPLLLPFLKRFLPEVKQQIVVGTAIFMLSFAVVAFAGHFAGFLVAMGILTVGEMLVWPAVPAVANTLSPKGREGFYQGIINSVATCGRMIGPVVGGFVADAFGMKALFGLLIIFLAISLLLALLYDRPLVEKSHSGATGK